jgi:hypothetical protein
VGTCFEAADFREGDAGCAEGFELAGPKDFPGGGYRLHVEGGLQVCEITPEAQTNGDAGIVRTYAAEPGQEYSAEALVRVSGASPGFKARLTIAAKRGGGRQLQEFNDRIESDTGDFVPMEVTGAIMPPGTELVTVKFRAHTREPGAAGTAELQRLTFLRRA